MELLKHNRQKKEESRECFLKDQRHGLILVVSVIEIQSILSQ